MPTETLPEALAGLARRHALELSERHWQQGVDDLIGSLERVLGPEQDPTPRDQPTGGREAIARGFSRVAEAVRTALGPEGREVVVLDESGQSIWTRDGLVIAEAFQAPENKLERLGVELAKETARKTVAEAGAGASTSLVLAEAIIAGGLTGSRADTNPRALQRGIASAVASTIEFLERQSTDIASKEELVQVATSATQEPEIGDLIADAIEKVGKDGVVRVEEGQTFGLELVLTEGMRFDKGYISPHMVTDPERLEAVLEDPYILVANRRIDLVFELLPVLELVIQASRPLLIIADDVEGESLATLIVNKERETFMAIAVKAPEFGDLRTAVLEDIAILTGAEVIADERGLKLEKTELAQLGRAMRVVAAQDSTTIIDGAGDPGQIKARIMQLKTGIESTDSEFERKKLQERLAKVAGGVAIIKVGAPTPGERLQRTRHYEHAVRLVLAAIDDGVVPGAGIALLGAQRSIAEVDHNEDLLLGANLVVQALDAPAKALAENGGFDANELLRRTAEEPPGHGLDVASGRYGDLRAAGVVDPLRLVRAALENAASVAGRVLTSETIEETAS
jgi:chaperonin GroEL